jgi:bifunctional isochorismate lyase / aryl carrier protein
VINTRHGNTPADAGMMAAWWGRVLEAGSPAAEIDPRIAAAGMHVLAKTQYDAFHATDLESQLRDAAVSQVVVTGVMTHLCCETTARSAFVRGFGVFFPVDATATYNRELHMASLHNLGHGFAELVLSHALIAHD